MNKVSKDIQDIRLQRLSAFTTHADGGNPAGVWIDDELPDTSTMQAIATAVGYSETAFVAPRRGYEKQIRYFSPLGEVAFCGHATIATGVALGQIGAQRGDQKGGERGGQTAGQSEGPGRYTLSTRAGDVTLQVSVINGAVRATLTSVLPQQKEIEPAVLQQVLRLLDWDVSELDLRIPQTLAFAGAWHLVIAAGSKARLDKLQYDFDGLKALMDSHQLPTLQLVWKESDTVFHARNPFPVGGVVEDPATGAAAAALGGYLRDAGLMTAPFSFDIRQGEVMGRPSLLRVDVPVEGGVDVSGGAVVIDC
ncbi:MAG: PhzF family phenazine biosynthesis isomerase [Pseudohongiella sp.]|nr:PhzF family phenazine biosynthesis isomerase [Pseudohongiella sp.]